MTVYIHPYLRYNFYNQFDELNHEISNVSSRLSSVSQSLNKSIVNQSLALSSRISTDQILSIASLVIGILALALTLILRSTGKKS